MLRSSLIVAAATLLCTTAAAQNRVASGDILPVDPASVKHAGVVDVYTGKWQPAGTSQKATQNVFNNTCFYNAGTGFIYYTTAEYCSEFYDEGLVPSSSNSAWQTASGGSGNVDSYTIDAFEVTYCTWNATVTLEIAFWDNLGGGCVGGVAPTSVGNHWSNYNGHTGTFTPAPAGYFDLSTLGLPGSSSPGTALACWIVGISNTGFTLAGDGDGAFDNDPTNDVFTWAGRINDVPPGANNNGFLITGDPNGTPGSSGSYLPGNCTFGLACGTDWIGGICGNGYGSEDLWWINTDGGLGAPVGCPGSANSGCYWFGGYPTNLQGGFWMRMEADVASGPGIHCTSRPTSVAGCLPTLTGPATATIGGSGDVAPCGPTPGGGNGLLMFNNTLAASPITLNFGDLCIQPPPKRAVSTFSTPGGTYPNCDGQYNFNLNNLVNTANANGQLNVGDTFYIQAWYRDTPNPFSANFSNAWGAIAVQ